MAESPEARVEELNAAVAAERRADVEHLQARLADAEARLRAAEEARAEADRRREQESTRLEKLWDAYKAQEHDLRVALERAGRLERELRGKDVSVSESARLLVEREDELRAAREQLEEERRRVAALEIARQELADAQRLRDRVDELEGLYAQERERLAKLYVVYEELEAERDDLARRLEEKEAWFRKYEAALKELTGKR